MWLSKMISKNTFSETAEKGSVTFSDSSQWEASASAGVRNVNSYAPYGYQSAVPVGQEVILVPSSDGQVALGTKTDTSSLETGEIRICSLGGASIILKNDGSVVINSLVVDKDGVIKN